MTTKTPNTLTKMKWTKLGNGYEASCRGHHFRIHRGDVAPRIWSVETVDGPELIACESTFSEAKHAAKVWVGRVNPSREGLVPQRPRVGRKAVMDTAKPLFNPTDLRTLPRHERGVDWGVERKLVIARGAKSVFWVPGHTALSGWNRTYEQSSLLVDDSKTSYCHRRLAEGGSLAHHLLDPKVRLEIATFLGVSIDKLPTKFARGVSYVDGPCTPPSPKVKEPKRAMVTLHVVGAVFNSDGGAPVRTATVEAVESNDHWTLTPEGCRALDALELLDGSQGKFIRKRDDVLTVGTFNTQACFAKDALAARRVFVEWTRNHVEQLRRKMNRAVDIDAAARLLVAAKDEG